MRLEVDMMVRESLSLRMLIPVGLLVLLAAPGLAFSPTFLSSHPSSSLLFSSSSRTNSHILSSRTKGAALPSFGAQRARPQRVGASSLFMKTGGHKKATKRGERGPGPAPSSRKQEQATSSRRVSGAGQDGHHHDAASHSPAAKVTRPTGSSTAAPNHSSHQQQPEAPSGASGH